MSVADDSIARVINRTIDDLDAIANALEVGDQPDRDDARLLALGASARLGVLVDFLAEGGRA